MFARKFPYNEDVSLLHVVSITKMRRGCMRFNVGENQVEVCRSDIVRENLSSFLKKEGEINDEFTTGTNIVNICRINKLEVIDIELITSYKR